jgi:hypothetical protein
MSQEEIDAAFEKAGGQPKSKEIIGTCFAKYGRPRKFQTVDDLWQRAGEYFNERQNKLEPLTVTGLALALGTTRETLMDYEGGKYDGEDGQEPRFSDAVKLIKAFVRDYAESQLYKLRNPAGAIFWLKNHGWSDRQEVVNSDPGRDEVAKKIISMGGFKLEVS